MKKMNRIKLIIDNQLDDQIPHHFTVDATDRIEVIIDEYGITARSDGEKFDIIKQEDNNNEIVFNNQLELFDSKPWVL